MNIRNSHCLLLYLVLLPYLSPAQNSNSYNLDWQKGLPSDHVYGATTDGDGYLWLCTPAGIARYNGYTSRIYNLSDSLPNNDIFGLYLDRRNRLWLRSFSDKIGYIYHNKYHPVYLKGIDQVLTPRHIGEYDGGIFFLTGTAQRNGGDPITQLFLEYRDTISIASSTYHLVFPTHPSALIDYHATRLCHYQLDEKGNAHLKNTCTGETLPELKQYTWSVFRQYTLHHRGNQLISINTTNCRKDTTSFSFEGQPDTIVRASQDLSDRFYLICRHNIYHFDTAMRLRGQWNIEHATGASLRYDDVNTVYTDPFWGACITTKTNGAYLHYPLAQVFQPLPVPGIEAYKPCGTANDSLAFWWDRNRQSLLCIGEDGSWHLQQTAAFRGSAKMVPYGPERSLILSLPALPSWYDHKTRNILPVTAPGMAGHSLDLYDAVVGEDSNIYYTASYSGLSRLNMKAKQLNTSAIGDYWYRKLAPDPIHHILWAYTGDRILWYAQGHSRVITGNELQQYHIRDIDQIIPDPVSGNIFLKDHSNLYLFDQQRLKLRRLFRNYNLKDTRMALKKNTIILAGQFGVLLSRIDTLGRVAPALVYPNIKNAWYRQVDHMTVLRSKIILQTDRGLYMVHMPTDSQLRHSSYIAPPYRFLVNYRDDVYQLPFRSPLRIAQRERLLSLDVINPSGNGNLHFRYQLKGVDSGWQELQANELYLPELTAGKTYTLSLIAGDDVWNSNRIDMPVYIIPYWWQTTKGMILILLFGLILVGGCLLWIVWLTRHYTVKANRKKRKRTELELRAVYAQLNPHFIFNTLNSALHFIKKRRTDEAYEHVSKFSRLLRAYLESSRNRFITVTEEITNLRAYIELQQTRFGNSFTYSIYSNLPLNASVYIPSLLLQPIVENAINHGLLPRDEAGGHLDIRFKSDEQANTIICTIEDNGIGREQARTLAQQNSSGRKSFGGELILELMELFNKQDQFGVTINYTDKAGGTGTLVTLTIKKSLYEKSF